MSNSPIFYDPDGSRRRVLSVGTSLAIAVVAVVAIAFSFTVAFAPVFGSQAAKRQRRSYIPTQQSKLSDEAALQLAKTRAKLLDKIASDRPGAARPITKPHDPICAAFYAPWQETGIHSLRANASKLTHLIPQWVHLNPDGTGIDLTSDFDPKVTPANEEVMAICKQEGVKVFPILDNSFNGKFVASRAHAFLSSPAAMESVARELAKWLAAHGFQGINLDFEEIGDEDQMKLAGFATILKKAFGTDGPRVTIDIEASTSLKVIKALSDAADWVVLMTYDEHSEDGEPGPIASLEWTLQRVREAKTVIPESKLVCGIGAYAYDWEVGHGQAQSLTYQEAISLAKDNREGEKPEEVLDFDPESMNSRFDYVDEGGHRHLVWILDGASAYNQKKLEREIGVRGSAVWALGSEDPSIWAFLGRGQMEVDPDPADLNTVAFPYEIDYEGEGEILEVKNLPIEGKRSFEIDSGSGLIVDLVYHAYPSPYVIRRRGFVPKKLALTFDDGPDGVYTPQILDVLKELKAPATFFVVGNNAEKFGSLMNRMVNEGHEIGSHSFTHPNLGHLDDSRVRLELNATQRAIESLTWRSTILFRPPYYADAEPSTKVEVEPVIIAASLGYVTVGELIDPEDWLLKARAEDGTVYARTADDIVAQVEAEAKKGVGNVILLHDAGGDRSQTVEALRRLIPDLRALGFEFVGVSRLMGMTRDQVMPPVSAKDRFAVGLDRVAFYAAFGLEAFLGIAFGVAIALGLARMLLVTPLAMIYKKTRQIPSQAGFHPEVSALIAAYNEAKVISRTIQSLLTSDLPPKEIIVVDDGSKDGTADVVRADFAGNPKVRVVSQENTGKAGAMNHAVSLASGDILICVDADTQLAPDCLGLMIRSFADPLVGAVAGNVRVGNQTNLLTSWQSVEYTTAQNLDRRAFALLNAVTVVPGAIGAWRKEAVDRAGGYIPDTLAEDMDLTWRIRQLGYEIEAESEALAFTEAPENLRSLFKQRFRWAYGTLQCLWKHRKAVFRNGWFGWLALPSLWLFQVGFNALAPLVDIQLVYSLFGYFKNYLEQDEHSPEFQPLLTAQSTLFTVVGLYLLFLAVEMVSGFIAYKMEGRSGRPVWSLVFQRFVYRQLMYAVIYRSIVTALVGVRQGWGKIDRKASVKVP